MAEDIAKKMDDYLASIRNQKGAKGLNGLREFFASILPMYESMCKYLENSEDEINNQQLLECYHRLLLIYYSIFYKVSDEEYKEFESELCLDRKNKKYLKLDSNLWEFLVNNRTRIDLIVSFRLWQVDKLVPFLKKIDNSQTIVQTLLSNETPDLDSELSLAQNLQGVMEYIMTHSMTEDEIDDVLSQFFIRIHSNWEKIYGKEVLAQVPYSEKRILMHWESFLQCERKLDDLMHSFNENSEKEIADSIEKIIGLEFKSCCAYLCWVAGSMLFSTYLQETEFDEDQVLDIFLDDLCMQNYFNIDAKTLLKEIVSCIKIDNLPQTDDKQNPVNQNELTDQEFHLPENFKEPIYYVEGRNKEYFSGAIDSALLNRNNFFENILAYLVERGYIDNSNSTKQLFVYRFTGKWRPEGVDPLAKIKWNNVGGNTQAAVGIIYLVSKLIGNVKGKWILIKEFFEIDGEWPENMRTLGENADKEYKARLGEIDKKLK